MNGQLNSNIYNASNNEADIEELQKQIDSLNTSVGSISEKLDETTEALNEYKAENNNQISTAEIISTSATVDNLSSNTINGTTLCINGTSNQKDINAEDICATGAVHADRLYGSLIGGSINGNCVSATNGKISNCLTAGTLNACNVHSTGNLTGNALTTNSICNNGDATITGCLNVKGICLTNGSNLYGNGIDVFSVWSRGIICALCHANIDGNLKVKGNITGKNINGNITSTNANITNGTVDNLTVNNTLTVANGITLPNTLGDTTLTSVTTDKLTVNGDTELNGAVKAGSITIGDGSITAGEVCIGAKGIVIDKDKNAAFADISSSNITAENINVNTKINASCVESKDVVAENTFAKNLYPENITIDKNVGDLHYSRQLDTDAVGAVLVDCKTVTPKEGATGIITKYKDSEANTINPDSIEYVNEKNGIKVVSCSTADKTSNAITLDTGTNVYSIKADETGFGIYAGDEKAFGVGVDGKANLCICKCTGADTLVGNVVKLDESGNLYTGRADGLSDGAIVDGVCSNTLKNTAINTDSSISRSAKGYNCYYNCYTRSLGATKNKIYDYCADTHSSCGECSYDITATTDSVITTFCNCCNMTGGTSITKDIYEVYPRKVCHNTSIKDANNVVKTDNLLICHSPHSATFLGRYSHIDDAYSWVAKICDSNICITNPSRTTTGEPEVILKVEDGKIYTKCGEFVAGGGSGGYFEDATFSNDCIRGTRSIVNDTITTCVVKSVSSDVDCYSFETSTPNSICFGFGTNNCLTDSSPIPENNYKKNYFIYTPNTNISVECWRCNGPLICTEWYQQIRTDCPICKATSCYNIGTNEYMYNYQQTSPTSGNVVSRCHVYTSNSLSTCSCLFSDKTSSSNCCRCSYIARSPGYYCCCNTYYNCQSNYRTCCYCEYTCDDDLCSCEITYCCNFECFTDSSCNFTCCYNICCGCYLSTKPAYTNCFVKKYCEPVEGNTTPICLGNYCDESDIFVYEYKSSCGDIYGCSCEWECEYEGDYECGYCTYYDYCPTYYGCESIYKRNFNGYCFCGCEYNTSTCQYDCFSTISCVSISDSSIYKYLCINNSYVSLKEKVVNNQIANLPITNTLVPLAGKVNGNGFAFFCKGADGIKFYDGAFATVDAGTATDVTYLVTTGV